MKTSINNRSTNTIAFSPRDNKLWALANWFIYDAKKNQLFLKDSYWLNKDCDDIAITYTERDECKYEDYPRLWAIKDMVTTHLRAKYAEQGKVVR